MLNNTGNVAVMILIVKIIPVSIYFSNFSTILLTGNESFGITRGEFKDQHEIHQVKCCKSLADYVHYCFWYYGTGWHTNSN